MKIGLFLLLLVTGTVHASYKSFHERVIESCYMDSMLTKDIATQRDKGYTVTNIQNILIRTVEATPDLSIADLTFSFLVTEMVFDRKNTTPEEFRESVLKDCLTMYDLQEK